MANLKVSQLTELSTQPADGDLVPIVDVSDTTDAASGTTKKIQYDNMIPDASDTVYGKTKLSTAPASATAPIAVGDNDTRIPSQDENDALVGTSGTPSTSNPYATKDTTDTLVADVQTFTSSGTWTKPSGTPLRILIQAWGAGGAGGSGNDGGGGGGGAYVEQWFDATDLDSTEAVTVGAGGTGSSGNGTAGGNSTVDLISGTLTAYGGGGGHGTDGGGGGGGVKSVGANGTAGNGGAGGSPIGGAGGAGGAGGTSIYGGGGGSDVGNAGGESIIGGGGGGAGSGAGGASYKGGGGGGGGSVSLPAGGTSTFGGNGGAGGYGGTAAVAGTIPGGGGGGFDTGGGAGNAANGADGQVIITTFS